MSELSDYIGDGLEMLEDTTGATVIWNGTSYPVTPTSATRSKGTAPGGLKLRSDLAFIVRPGVFTSNGPSLKHLITYGGRSYRIDSIEEAPGGAFTRYDCNDPTQ